MYSAGADTTVSAEYAMTLYPAIQRKAQAEIDSVIGTDRLPCIADRPRLPYVHAIVIEILRWNSVAPPGLPHIASEDGIVDGYFIPKGSVIVINLWNMLHDSETYPNPFVFNFDRHIVTEDNTVQQDPRSICFRYGRRVYLGMYLAEAPLFSAIAMSLAVFSVTKVIENGVGIMPVHENTSGFISYHEKFKCVIKPRSERAKALISNVFYF